MSARVSTSSYFLQGIIEIRCFQIRGGARMPFFARDEGGGSIPAWLGWYEFIWKSNTWSGSYMNFQSQRGDDKSGGGEGGRIYSLLRKENLCGVTYVAQFMRCMWCGATYVV